jgi:hypothetical protein
MLGEWEVRFVGYENSLPQAGSLACNRSVTVVDSFHGLSDATNPINCFMWDPRFVCHCAFCPITALP